MNRKSLRWLWRGAAIILVGWCLTSIILSQIILDRAVVVNVTGEANATIVANVNVDGKTMEITEELPAQFAYLAKHVLIEAKLSEPLSQGHISVTIYIDDVKQASVGAPAGQGVRMGFQGCGLLWQGKRKLWASSIWATDIAAK